MPPIGNLIHLRAAEVLAVGVALRGPPVLERKLVAAPPVAPVTPVAHERLLRRRCRGGGRGRRGPLGGGRLRRVGHDRYCEGQVSKGRSCPMDIKGDYVGFNTGNGEKLTGSVWL